MSETFRCDDKEMLVAYLYGEIEASGRREVERHLRTCVACTEEVKGLQAVRHDLESWQPPEAELGFTIVQSRSATVLRPSRWGSLTSVPVWAQAAAAVLVFAAGLAIANVHVKYDDAGLSVSTGWMSPPVPVQTAQAPSVVGVNSSAPASAMPLVADTRDQTWRAELALLEATLRNELAQMKRVNTVDDRQTQLVGSADAAALLRRVETMLEASEKRQRQELALRIAQVNRDVEMRRNADLMRISQDFGRLQGRTFANQQQLNLLRQTSVQVPE